jgi:hypothetical protein
MAQLPGPQPGWIPLSASQFLTAVASTALTIPSITAQSPPVKAPGGDYVAILIPQGGTFFVRTDGQAAVATTVGGLQMNSASGDFRIVYGLMALRNIRVIAGTGTGFSVEYYFYRVPNA